MCSSSGGGGIQSVPQDRPFGHVMPGLFLVDPPGYLFEIIFHLLEIGHELTADLADVNKTLLYMGDRKSVV